MDGGSERGWGRERKRGRWIDHKQRGTDCCVMAKSGLNLQYLKRTHNACKIQGKHIGSRTGGGQTIEVPNRMTPFFVFLTPSKVEKRMNR